MAIRPCLLLTLTCVFSPSCGSDDGKPDVDVGLGEIDAPEEVEVDEPDAVAETTADTEADVAEVVSEPIANAWQAVDLPLCDGIGPGSEACHYRLLWRPAACAGNAVSPSAAAAGNCPKLLVYWAGGEQSCDDGAYDKLLEKWADTGVLVACAQPFTTSDEAGRYPYADELERMDRLTQKIRAHAGSAWDGRYLVIGGVSHGATAPLAAIAKSRAFETRPEVWTGRDGTAVILFDGISDPARLEASVGLSDSVGCAPWHARFVGRYGDKAPLGHDCGNDACYCAGGGSGWEIDTTVIGQTAGPNWPASPYSCADVATPAQKIQYRVVSCGGGAAEPCSALGDIIPDDQQTRLVDALATCPEVAVTYYDHPGCGHSICGSWDFCGGEKAREWLTSLGW